MDRKVSPTTSTSYTKRSRTIILFIFILSSPSSCFRPDTELPGFVVKRLPWRIAGNTALESVNVMVGWDLMVWWGGS